MTAAEARQIANIHAQTEVDRIVAEVKVAAEKGATSISVKSLSDAAKKMLSDLGYKTELDSYALREWYIIW